MALEKFILEHDYSRADKCVRARRDRVACRTFDLGALRQVMPGGRASDGKIASKLSSGCLEFHALDRFT